MTTSTKAAKPRTAKKAAAPAAPAPIFNYPVIKDRAVIAAADTYANNKTSISVLEAENDRLKPQIIAGMAGAPIAYAGSRVLNLSEVAETPGTPNQTITRAMIGQVIPGKKGRKGYTQLTVQ